MITSKDAGFTVQILADIREVDNGKFAPVFTPALIFVTGEARMENLALHVHENTVKTEWFFDFQHAADIAGNFLTLEGVNLELNEGERDIWDPIARLWVTAQTH